MSNLAIQLNPMTKFRQTQAKVVSDCLIAMQHSSGEQRELIARFLSRICEVANEMNDEVQENY